MRLFGVFPINWEDSLKQLLFGQWWRSHQSIACKGLLMSRFCVVLGRWFTIQYQMLFEKKSWVGSKIDRSTKLWTRLTESRWNSSGIFSNESPHCSSSSVKSHEFMTNMEDPSQFKGRIISMSTFNDIIWCSEDNERELRLLTPHLWLYLQKDFQQDGVHYSDLDKNSGILLTLIDHKENGTESLNSCWSNSERADTHLTEPRVHFPEERS